MQIKTDSGNAVVNKRSRYAKFLTAYISTGAFSGHCTVSAAWRMAISLMGEYKSLSSHDAGLLVGRIFKVKPTEAVLKFILNEEK